MGAAIINVENDCDGIVECGVVESPRVKRAYRGDGSREGDRAYVKWEGSWPNGAGE